MARTTTKGVIMPDRLTVESLKFTSSARILNGESPFAEVLKGFPGFAPRSMLAVDDDGVIGWVSIPVAETTPDEDETPGAGGETLPAEETPAATAAEAASEVTPEATPSVEETSTPGAEETPAEETPAATTTARKRKTAAATAGDSADAAQTADDSAKTAQ
jgi:hypothetical protein